MKLKKKSVRLSSKRKPGAIVVAGDELWTLLKRSVAVPVKRSSMCSHFARWRSFFFESHLDGIGRRNCWTQLFAITMGVLRGDRHKLYINFIGKKVANERESRTRLSSSTPMANDR